MHGRRYLLFMPLFVPSSIRRVRWCDHASASGTGRPGAKRDRSRASVSSRDAV